MDFWQLAGSAGLSWRTAAAVVVLAVPVVVVIAVFGGSADITLQFDDSGLFVRLHAALLLHRFTRGDQCLCCCGFFSWSPCVFSVFTEQVSCVSFEVLKDEPRPKFGPRNLGILVRRGGGGACALGSLSLSLPLPSPQAAEWGRTGAPGSRPVGNLEKTATKLASSETESVSPSPSRPLPAWRLFVKDREAGRAGT